MQDVLSFLTSNQTLAIALPALIFIATIVLVVRQLIGFLMTMVFLIFALVCGVVIANYDVLRTYVENRHEEVTGIQAQFNDLKRELSRVFDDLESDLKDQRQNTRKVMGSARDLLDEMDQYGAAFRSYMEETVVPAIERALPKEDEEVETEEES